MFQFSTLNFINTATYLDGKTPKWTTNATTSPSFSGDTLMINKNRLVFEKDSVVAVYKRSGDYGACEVATLGNITISTDTTYKLEIWIRLSQACNDSLYANDFVFKGKPLTIEVDGATLANGTKFAKFMKRYQLAMYDGEIVQVASAANATTSTNTDITVTASNIYQRFEKVCLYSYSATPQILQDNWTKVKGFENRAEGLEVPDGGSAMITTVGRDDFGTYHQITKDLVLPTDEHLAWGHEMADERPIPGALYTQYTIHTCVKRQHPTGVGAVGEAVKSKTYHVFYVISSLTSAFETALGAITSNDVPITGVADSSLHVSLRPSTVSPNTSTPQPSGDFTMDSAVNMVPVPEEEETDDTDSTNNDPTKNI